MRAFILLICLITSQLSAYYNLAGIRDVQIRSDQVVTIWLGYNTTMDSMKLYDPSNYAISSPNDPNYKDKVHPVSVSRFMKGSRSANGPFDWRVFQDKLMHLKVESPFKKGYIYYVKMAEGLIPKNYPQIVQFSMDLTPNPSFKLNQVGYSNTAKTKLVYLSSYLGDGEPVDLSRFKDFKVVNATTKAVALKGFVQFVSDKDPQGYDKLYVLDISSLKAEGYYYVEIDGLGRSYVFQNGNNAPKEIIEKIARGYYFQRCGAELVPPFAEKWPHAMSHDKVYVPQKNIVHPWELHVNPLDPEAGDYYVPEGPREIHGGHHDAGDYDTRITHLVVPEKMMSLYEIFPEKFYDGQFFIPENANGIPDILDEAAWNLMHYEYLQDYFAEVRGEFGAVPAGMESTEHPPKFPVMGEGDVLNYFMRKATPYTSFIGSAVFAQAARIFAPFHQKKADIFLKRSVAAYKWAVKHRKEKYDPENPQVLPLAWEEEYDKGQLSAAWCWAAGQLFSTTGEIDYMKDFSNNYKKATKTFQKHKWTAMWPILICSRENMDPKVKKDLVDEFIAISDTTVQWVLNNGKTGYQTACPNQGDWGSASPLMQIEIISRAYLLTKKQDYLDVIASAVDFVLGMNPSEFSWMTGAGTVYPLDPLNANCKYDGVEEPFPGIVIFGPGDSWDHPQNPLYPKGDTMGLYRRISDVWGYVQGCEYVVDEQLANMLMAAGILSN